jgi:hypothetical protein
MTLFPVLRFVLVFCSTFNKWTTPCILGANEVDKSTVDTMIHKEAAKVAPVKNTSIKKYACQRDYKEFC